MCSLVTVVSIALIKDRVIPCMVSLAARGMNYDIERFAVKILYALLVQ